MKRSAKAVNRNLTDDYLERCTTRQLLSMVHPLERYDYARELGVKMEMPAEDD